MSKPTDQDLEKLFRAAKVMKPDVKDLEAGFESRLSARIREEERKETLLSVWAWRLAPVMAIPLLNSHYYQRLSWNFKIHGTWSTPSMRMKELRS